jgi:hypothetical protein
LAATPSIAAQFDAYTEWRRGFSPKLRALSDWLRSVGLLEPSVAERLQRIEARSKADKVTVAFVAEFSRGKSELINALFFADYKRRIMPATAGRTTMCLCSPAFGCCPSKAAWSRSR